MTTYWVLTVRPTVHSASSHYTLQPHNSSKRRTPLGPPCYILSHLWIREQKPRSRGPRPACVQHRMGSTLWSSRANVISPVKLLAQGLARSKTPTVAVLMINEAVPFPTKTLYSTSSPLT